jgi:hypothetical protein
MAQGAYAVGLPSNTPGSTYYWYHQSSSCGNCEYCGDWGTATWGSGGKFASDGCAMFSAAMLVSNLTGQEITPLKFLEDIGCEINDNNTYISTSSCEWLNDHSIAKGGEEFANFICEKYGLQNTGSLATYDKSKMQSAIDDVLSKGGMVLYRFSNPNDEVSQWVTTSSHFICIREKIDDKYYTLDSCNRPDSAGATEPVTFDTIYNRLYSGTDYMIGFWNGAAGSSNNSGTTGNSGNVPVGTGGWYGAGTDIPTYSNTKDLGDGFYLYNGLPWAANASTVTIDTDTMLIDMFNYAKNVSTTKTAKATLFGSGGTCEAVDVLTTHDRMHADPTGVSPDGGNWKSCDGGRLYVEIDGVKASGVGTIPAIMNPDFNRGFGPYD